MNKSTKPMPYVYKGVNRETGEIYIGYRERNVKSGTVSSDDLGVKYFTSGGVTRSSFNEFDWVIVAEFFDPVEAYWFEQELIQENWEDPLLLNKQYYNRCTTNGIFRHTGKTAGFTGRKHTDETKKKMSNPLTKEIKSKISEKVRGENHPNFGKELSSETRRKISESRKRYYSEHPPVKGRPMSDLTRQKLLEANLGKTISDETKAKMREAAKHRPPISEETRLKRSESLKEYHRLKKEKSSDSSAMLEC